MDCAALAGRRASLFRPLTSKLVSLCAIMVTMWAVLLAAGALAGAATQLAAAIAEQPVAHARTPSTPGQPPGGPPRSAGLPIGSVRCPDRLAPSGSGGRAMKPEGLEPLGRANRVSTPEALAPSGLLGSSSGRFARSGDAPRPSTGARGHAAGPHSINEGDSAAGGSSSGSIMAGGGGSAADMVQVGRRAGPGLDLGRYSDHEPGGGGGSGGLTAQVSSKSRGATGVCVVQTAAMRAGGRTGFAS